MSVRVLPRLLSAVVVGVVGVVVVGAGCLSEIAAPGCRGPTCKVVDDNAEPPRLFVDPPFGLGFDCVTLGCDVERRMVVENRGGGTISLALARLSVDTSTDFSLRTAESLSRSVGEYFTEERRTLPTRMEVEEFFSDVDRVTNDVERAEARVARQQERLKDPAS